MSEQAVGYWQQAGKNALQRSAYTEASAYLTKGVALLQTLPDTSERAQREFGLQVALGPVLQALKGQAAAEAGEVYARARELCEQVGDISQLCPSYAGLRCLTVIVGNSQPLLR